MCARKHSSLTKNAKQKHSQRKRARAKYLRAIAIEQKGLCAECRCILRMDLIGIGHQLTGDLDDRATIDHIIDIGDGGTNNRKNLRVLCYRCNQNKNDKKNREKNENSYNAR